MIVECSYCQSRVDARVLVEHKSFDPEKDPFPFKATLVECPSCKNCLLVGQDLLEVAQSRYEWDQPARLWPSPKRYIPWNIPAIVRSSLEEAERCLKAKAFTGCAIMCGRSLEGVCRHFQTKNQYLGGGIKELLDRKIIDGRLYEWSEALREQRNKAAHASTDEIGSQDAKDLIDFVFAICEYVFVLTAKYDEFRKRHSKKADTEVPAGQQTV